MKQLLAAQPGRPLTAFDGSWSSPGCYGIPHRPSYQTAGARSDLADGPMLNVVFLLSWRKYVLLLHSMGRGAKCYMAAVCHALDEGSQGVPLHGEPSLFLPYISSRAESGI